MVKKQYVAVRKKIIPAYTEYFKYSGINGEIVGDPTIDENGVISNFSDENYIKIPYMFGLDDYMEVVIGFTISQGGLANQAILDAENVSGRNMRLTIANTNKPLWRIITGTATETYAYSLTSSQALTLNQYYIIRCSYSSTTGYKMELSSDNGETFTTVSTNTSTTRPNVTGATFLLGENSATGLSLEGSINAKSVIFSNQNGVVFELAKYDAPATEEDYERKVEHPEETKVKEYTFYRRTGGYNRRFFIERVKESFNNSNMEIE